MGHCTTPSCTAFVERHHTPCPKCAALAAATPPNGAPPPPPPPPPAAAATAAAAATPWTRAACTWCNNGTTNCAMCGTSGGPLTSSTNFGNICYANCILMLLCQCAPILEFKQEKHNELWKTTVEAPSFDARGNCVKQWIAAASAIYPDQPFDPDKQDDFDRFARAFAELTTGGFAAFGGDSTADIIVCGPLDLPTNPVRGHIVHRPGHWSAYCGAPGSELVAAMMQGAKVTVYCIVATQPAAAWACPACTFENVSEHSNCGMCRAPRPAVQLAAQPAATWTCSACTVVNDGGQSQCETCGAALPAAQPAAQPAAVWACPVCTFENSIGDSTCSMCETAKK